MKETIRQRSTLFGQYRIVQASDNHGYLFFKTYFDTSSPLIFGKSKILYVGTDINQAHDVIENDIQARRTKKYKPTQINFTFQEI